MARRISAAAAPVAVAVAATLFTVSALVSLSFDVGLSRNLVAWRAANPGAVQALILFTQLGGAAFLLPLTALAAVLTARRSIASAMLLAATILGGRLAIALMKEVFDRARPAFDPHPVTTTSYAFPSGHAGNSMITFLAIALIALPERWRGHGAAAAILLSIAVGMTRPLLGVHWPTDVLGGWTFALAWVWLCLEAARRFRLS